jgi:uncharacterized membrane protein
MTFSSLLSAFSTLDFAALAFLVGGWLVLGHLTDHPPARHPSVSLLMKRYRHEWMRQFVTRQPRIFDAAIIDSLRQGTSFFASACMIAIGGGVAVIGNPGRLQDLTDDLSLSGAAPLIWQAKVLVVVLFLTNALLKFVWAHRLFGYNAILMAAVPNDPADPQAYARAEQAADINIHAARSFNRGLRSIYFALGALGWLLGPVALTAATAATIYVAWRREFASNSRRILMRGLEG